MSLWEGFFPVPADPVIGVADAAARDPNPDTVDLSVGGYRDGSGRVPLLGAVGAALVDLLSGSDGRGYGRVLGPDAFVEAVVDLILPGPRPGGIVGAQAVGGTGALRLLVDTWVQVHPLATVWVTDPAYPNHIGVALASGAQWAPYPHDPLTEGIDMTVVVDALAPSRPGDLLVVHGCCHNPTGRDPSPKQWTLLAELAKMRRLLPVIDLAYLGFGEGIEEDLAAVRAFAAVGHPFAVCVSFSKNMALAGERVGALVVCTADEDAVDGVRTRLASVARALWSSPPRFGAELVANVLRNRPDEWRVELEEMAERLRGTRRRLYDLLQGGARLPLDGLLRQRGLFWYSGLSRDQVRRLREEHSVYVLDNGRMNLGALADDAVERVAKAIIAVC